MVDGGRRMARRTASRMKNGIKDKIEDHVNLYGRGHFYKFVF